MKGVNKVIVIGTVGKDPEVKYFPNGDAFCNFSIASSEQWKDKATGERKEATEWIPLVVTRQLAEIVGKYVRKGSKIYIEGKFKTRKWQDKDGKDQYKTEVDVRELQMLDGPKQQDEGGQQEAPRTRTAPAPARQAPVTQEHFDEDDIPF